VKFRDEFRMVVNGIPVGRELKSSLPLITAAIDEVKGLES
jgi:hypothetical protein